MRHQVMACAAAAMLVLAWAGAMIAAPPASAPAQGQVCDLSIKPKFAIGDKITVAQTLGTNSRIVSDNLQVRHMFAKTLTVQETFEVLTLDKGAVQSVRLRADNLEEAQTRRSIEIEDYDHTFSAQDLVCTLNRKGSGFEPDLATLSSAGMITLSAPQAHMVKRVLAWSVDWPACPRLAAVLPAGPVKVGDAWEPREAFGKYLDETVDTKGHNVKLGSVKFRLDSVDKGIATVEGQAALTYGQNNAPLTHEITIRIDTASGVWTEFYSRLSRELPAGKARELANITRRYTVSVEKGNGKATALPPRLNSLNWRNPTKDTSSWVDEQVHYGLDIPKNFTSSNSEKGAVATFVSDKIRVTVAGWFHEEYWELEQEVRPYLDKMVKDKSMEVVERKDVLLLNNVPATMVIGKIDAGKTAHVFLMAVDGHDYFDVRVTLPWSDENVGLAKRLAMTLRVTPVPEFLAFERLTVNAEK